MAIVQTCASVSIIITTGICLFFSPVPSDSSARVGWVGGRFGKPIVMQIPMCWQATHRKSIEAASSLLGKEGMLRRLDDYSEGACNNQDHAIIILTSACVLSGAGGPWTALNKPADLLIVVGGDRRQISVAGAEHTPRFSLRECRELVVSYRNMPTPASLISCTPSDHSRALRVKRDKPRPQASGDEMIRPELRSRGK
ncbi:hypothetical protein CKAH01_12135 [Colletotrichum kahawae]|uniref:Uncharacterized protein n=1 Tax=Colletotrichum kahawae TaxID=34407 RepID=A0AAD9YUB9_COLKA|nr:hypothetical protein CKAH01_12135 [Colletotrichum kahawae]